MWLFIFGMYNALYILLFRINKEILTCRFTLKLIDKLTIDVVEN
jgi:hypothetical protein